MALATRNPSSLSDDDDAQDEEEEEDGMVLMLLCLMQCVVLRRCCCSLTLGLHARMHLQIYDLCYLFFNSNTDDWPEVIETLYVGIIHLEGYF